MSDTSESHGPSPQGILKKPTFVAKSNPEDSLLQIPLHLKPFMLRFTQRRDLGRSYVSLVKPLGLEATVTPKFHTKSNGDIDVSEEHTERVFNKIQEKFTCGPREKYDAPNTSAQVYGWWWDKATPVPHQHHIKDSYWLKTRIAILTADQKLKRH